MNNGVKGERGFIRSEDSKRFGVRINSNIVELLKERDINIVNVIKKAFDEDIKEIESGSVSVSGTFNNKEQLEKYLKLKNKRVFIERILLNRLLEK